MEGLVFSMRMLLKEGIQEVIGRLICGIQKLVRVRHQKVVKMN
jgi:hypothetical protein